MTEGDAPMIRRLSEKPGQESPTTSRVERSWDTLVACPECLAAVNASLEVERAILDVLTRLAVSPAWDGARAPRLDAVVTRLVQDYRERVQLRVASEPLSEEAMRSDELEERTRGGRA